MPSDCSKSSVTGQKGIRKKLSFLIPSGMAVKFCAYLDFLPSFLSLAGFSMVFFGKISQPQPQFFFFFVIKITPFFV